MAAPYAGPPSGDLAGTGARYRGGLPGGLEHVPGRAGHLEADRLAAVPVPDDDLRAGRADRVLVAPVHQRQQHRVQVQALLGEPVLGPAALAALLVGDLAQQALVYQPGQPLAEHLAGHAGAALHVVEAAHAVEGFAQDEERRPFTEDAHGRADRAVGRVVVEDPWPCHTRMLSPVDRLSNPESS